MGYEADSTAQQKEASNPETQLFHQISADLTIPSEAVRVVDEVVSWNSGNPPDIVSKFCTFPPPHSEHFA